MAESPNAFNRRAAHLFRGDAWEAPSGQLSFGSPLRDSLESRLFGHKGQLVLDGSSDGARLREEHATFSAELQECQRALIRTRVENSEAESRAREAEDGRREEMEALVVQLDALGSTLQVDVGDSFACEAAGRLLGEARSQLAELQTEVFVMEAQTELVATEAKSGRSHLESLEQNLQPALLEEWHLAEENAALRETAAVVWSELAAHHSEEEEEALGDRCARAEEALAVAEGRIQSYEEWSQGVHDELRQVAQELREDQEVHAEESLRLEARAAELEAQRDSRSEASHWQLRHGASPAGPTFGAVHGGNNASPYWGSDGAAARGASMDWSLQSAREVSGISAGSLIHSFAGSPHDAPSPQGCPGLGARPAWHYEQHSPHEMQDSWHRDLSHVGGPREVMLAQGSQLYTDIDATLTVSPSWQSFHQHPDAGDRFHQLSDGSAAWQRRVMRPGSAASGAGDVGAQYGDPYAQPFEARQYGSPAVPLQHEGFRHARPTPAPAFSGRKAPSQQSSLSVSTSAPSLV